MSTRTYESVPGFFVQDDPSPIFNTNTAVPPRFGLIDTSTHRWTTFIADINQLNENANAQTSYKVFFFARHGEGFHNVAERKYGSKAWNDYWAMLNGDGEITWGPDPELTSIGRDQARDVHEAWRAELAANMPLPEKLYCSPLTRALTTNQITFGGILADESRRTVVVENCREEYGEHTCDKRKSLTYIRSAFPRLQVEDGFKEEDELWTANARETKEHVAVRARDVLDSIFAKDNSSYISITAHGGIINAFLTNIGRKPYALSTGGVLPVVVKAVLT